jgi:UPF0755 protein
MRRVLTVLAVLLLAVAGVALYLQHEWHTPGRAADGGIVEIPRGLRTREILGLLHEKKVIRNSYSALAFLFYSGARHRLQAGEYLFDQPLTIPEVIAKLTSGTVVLHKLTVPEGFTTEAIAHKWQDDGFGSADDFMKAASGATDLVQRFDQSAVSVEGYLFPDTYSFRKHTTARQAIEAMVGGFQQVVGKLQQALPVDMWPLNLHDTVVLASLVETEAAQPDERPLVASVYVNRLNRHILLQCDPTVIYALEQADEYHGTLTLADLRFKSPYNTYMEPGLPPGPIANPGYPSLLAAIQPATTNYLFFVRTPESRHMFSENLTAHNRAVAAYRKLLKKKAS